MDEATASPEVCRVDGGPLKTYSDYLEARRATRDRMERRFRIISTWRLLTFGAAAALLVTAMASSRVAIGWSLAPLSAYVVLAVYHERIVRQRDRASTAADYYERLVARVSGSWSGKGVTGEEWAADGHRYAIDLDIVGRGSLVERMSLARTGAGVGTLTRWLLDPASADEVRARQAAVEELRNDLDLRERLMGSAGGINAIIDVERFSAWAAGPPLFTKTAERVYEGLAWAIGTASITLCGLWWLKLTTWVPLAALALVVLTVGALSGRVLRNVVEGIHVKGIQLAALSRSLTVLEQGVFRAEKLVALQKRLQTHAGTPSQVVRRLDRLVMWLDSQRNPLFAPVGFFLMWTLHFGLAIEQFRAKFGQAVGPWLECVGELEALCDLAAYAFENPEDPFPELVDGPPSFVASELGHPLLPQASCVRNDVDLSHEVKAWIVSGSNMSGKSTLLRTVGINAVLAQAGSVVRARALRLSPLSLGATIRVHDSLQGGSSRFYAEISRLKELMDIAQASDRPPLLFLLDEILHGTNSHDRKIGALAVLQELIRVGAIGLMTTHDLALADATGTLQAQIRNVHFSDTVRDGVLHFDYRIREGVVQGSNALELMRVVGLRV